MIPGPDQLPLPAEDLEDPRVIEALEQYLEALESGQRPNRQAFLARYAEIAPALAECLEGMEALHGAGSSAPAAGEGGTGLASEWQPGTVLGEYRIIREVGRGGMGVVYEAEQLSLGRRIALKVLPFAWSLDPRQLQRFKNEARAAAQLHHQNIVPVYAVGCERGVHFFAMQYIEGHTLVEVIREMRQLATANPSPQTPPRNGEGEKNKSSFPRTVAQLGLQAAEALEHAHELGVVHRDIKPGNLLVDLRGQLWVSDFGLAQFQRDAALTLTGDLLGTLRYMSPEQAQEARRGVVDHRTDIYSLGVTLYELLTGEPPFAGQDREELLQQITWKEPIPPARREGPRKRGLAIPADLETIVLKAMARRPEDRYATARELAEDLRRFLEQKPILARRPSLLERTARWARRHRTVVAAGVGVLLLAAVGFGVSTVLIAREQAKSRGAYHRLAEEQSRTRAAYEAEVRNFQQARRMLDFFARVSAEELADKPEVQEVRRRMLEAALEYYQDFIVQCPDDPSTRDELANSHLHVANLLNEMGATADALAALEQAQRILDKKPASAALSLDWLRNGGPLLLLEQRCVQEELKFSEEQSKQVSRLAARRRTAFWDNHDLSLERWRSKFEELAAQEKALLEGLRPEQTQRLKQIAWQEGGASAFSDPELLDGLGASDEQKARINKIQNEARRAAWPAPRLARPQAEDWKKAAETWRRSRDRVLGVLTEEQKEKWAELTGEPFKGEIRLPFPSGFTSAGDAGCQVSLLRLLLEFRL